jgi:ferredoxin
VTKRVAVTFDPPGVSVEVDLGTSALEASRRAGVSILAPCGGQGTCGKCAVRVAVGDPGPPDPGPRHIPLPGTMRLACLLRPTGDVVLRPVNVVRVPHHDEVP